MRNTKHKFDGTVAKLRSVEDSAAMFLRSISNVEVKISSFFAFAFEE